MESIRKNVKPPLQQVIDKSSIIDVTENLEERVSEIKSIKSNNTNIIV